MIDEKIIKEQRVATILFGVNNCGGGLVIVNGKPHVIPPRGPSYQKINEALQVILHEMNIPHKQ